MIDKALVIRVALLLLGGLGLWLLAKRKNRTPWPWGIIGGIAGGIAPIILLIPLLILGFMKYKCARCGAVVSNEQARSSQCPACEASGTAKALP